MKISSRRGLKWYSRTHINSWRLPYRHFHTRGHVGIGRPIIFAEFLWLMDLVRGHSSVWAGKSSAWVETFHQKNYYETLNISTPVFNWLCRAEWWRKQRKTFKSSQIAVFDALLRDNRDLGIPRILISHTVLGQKFETRRKVHASPHQTCKPPPFSTQDASPTTRWNIWQFKLYRRNSWQIWTDA